MKLPFMVFNVPCLGNGLSVNIIDTMRSPKSKLSTKSLRDDRDLGSRIAPYL